MKDHVLPFATQRQETLRYESLGPGCPLCLPAANDAEAYGTRFGLSGAPFPTLDLAPWNPTFPKEQKDIETMTGVLASLATTSGLLAGSLGPLDWMESYGQALDTTKLASRPLLVVIESAADFHQTDAPASFYRPGGPADLLRHYTLCRVDADTEYGRRVMEAFQATDLPYTAIIDRQGAHLLFRKQGQMEVSQLVKTLHLYKQGKQPTATETRQAEQAVALLAESLPHEAASQPVSTTTPAAVPAQATSPASSLPVQTVIPSTVTQPAKSTCFT